ncbi:hypothetical protein B0E43_13925 [Algoriphagus sp. A40]|nr:hypothetical protein B0E43_13925 [Algoriphagus sp. A40]
MWPKIGTGWDFGLQDFWISDFGFRISELLNQPFYETSIGKKLYSLTFPLIFQFSNPINLPISPQSSYFYPL